MYKKLERDYILKHSSKGEVSVNKELFKLNLVVNCWNNLHCLIIKTKVKYNKQIKEVKEWDKH